MILVPLRVEDAEVDRMPWVSIGIAALCLVSFALTWVAPAHPDGISRDQLEEILGFYEQHPYLELEPAFAQEFLRPRAAAKLAELHTARPAGVDDEAAASEQRELDRMVDRFRGDAHASAMRRFSLIPARGLAQPGLITHMFLHFGWMHLLGNLLFFYIVGPLLEDLWGRVFFPGFYLAGGLVAGVAHFALDPHSTVMMAGASGAIAACMGAFTYRFAERKIRMGYVLGWFKRGTFLIPAWLWGGAWFALEVVSFLLRSSQGVAVMAHIGGFVFGIGAAVALVRSGSEEKYFAGEVRRRTVWEQHPAIDRANAALDAGDTQAALAAFREALPAREAAVGVAKLGGELGPAAQHIKDALARGDSAAAWSVVLDLGDSFQPEKIDPRVAWQLASAREAAPEGLAHLAEKLDAAVGKSGGALGAKAYLRAAKTALARNDADAARGYVEAAKWLGELPPELASQLGELRKTLNPEPPPENAVRILTCRVKALAEDAIELQAQNGATKRVEWQQLVGLSAGLVPTPQGNAILTDFVLSWGDAQAAPAAIPVPGPMLGLAQLYPGLPLAEAYKKLVAHVLSHSSAQALPDRTALERGAWPKYASVAALNAAVYGKRS